MENKEKFCCWSEYFFRSRKNLPGRKRVSRSKDRVTIITCGLVVRKWLIRFFITAGESYLNISFSSLFVFFFCCSSRSETSKLSGSPSWIFLWSKYDRRVPTFYIWCTATPNVCAQSLIFCLCYGAIGTGDRIWILVWPTGSWHVCVQDTKTLDL